MNFSDFSKTLFVYCSNGESQANFVQTLTDKIMSGQPGRVRKNDIAQNPMRNKDERTLLAYFNGERCISQGDASIILCSVDKYKFEEYLRYRCSDDAQSLLWDDISQMAEINNAQDIAEICADMFVAILHDLAAKKRK